MKLDQEQRVMLAFALSILIMFLLYRSSVFKAPPPEPKSAATAQSASPSALKQSGSAAPSASAVPAAPVTLPVTQGTAPEEIVVEGALYRVTFSTQGAVVKSWTVTKYHDANDHPLDFVNAPACESLGYPMSLELPNPALTSQVNKAIYVAEANHEQVHGGAVLSAPATLSFTYSDGRVQVKKQFSFGADYVARIVVSASEGANNLPFELTWRGGFGDVAQVGASDTYRQAVFGAIGDLSTVAQGKVKEPRTVPAPLQLAGVEDKFFAAIALPASPEQVSFRLERQEWAPPDWTEKEKPKFLAESLVDVQGKPLDFRLFVGPKSLDVLKAVNPPLDSIVDFGWFSIIAKPLFIAMRYIHDHWVHNYGWAIVILTLIITLAMLPLRFKGLRSAQEMQKVAPIIKGIQDKYKNYKFNDPRKAKMNEEVMKVYSEHGINPLASCLPMVLQLPFLYGFYRVLDLAIELRHAPWMGWVTDLSAPDRLHLLGFSIPVLVILMTVASFILQRMTPMTAADPSQQRMMMLMPLMFAFMFFRLPSGMVLYWFTSSVAQIVQQLFLNRRMPPPAPLPVPRKPVEAKR